MALVEQNKSGAVPPADVEFEDYSQTVRAATSDNTAPNLPKVRIKQLFQKKYKVHTHTLTHSLTLTHTHSTANRHHSCLRCEHA